MATTANRPFSMRPAESGVPTGLRPVIYWLKNEFRSVILLLRATTKVQSARCSTGHLLRISLARVPRIMTKAKPRTIATICTQFLMLSTLALPASAQEDDGGGFKYFEVKVIDPAGQPVTDAEVTVSIDGPSFPMFVDDQGMISLNVPQGSWFQVRIVKDGYQAIGARWNKEDKVPDLVTIPLRKGVEMGGVVLDEHDQPVEGVTVKATIFYDSHVHGQSGEGQFRPMLSDEIATTDSEGRWSTFCAPTEHVDFSLRFNHADYVANRRVSVSETVSKELRSLKHTVRLESGITLRGTVFDDQDQPVVGAKVMLGASRYHSDRQEVETDESGQYLINKVSSGNAILTVTHRDWAPDLRILTTQPKMAPIDFRLTSGSPIRIRIVDEKGEPVAGATVQADEWQGYRTLGDATKGSTDPNGNWQWDHAPSGEIRYSVYKRGRFSIDEQDEALMKPSAEVHTLTMLPQVVVTGHVVDKTTKQPIDRFRFTNSVWWNARYSSPTLQSHGYEDGRDGQYRFVMSSSCEKFLLEFQCKGYLPAQTRPILPEEGTVEIDVEMEPGVGPSGTVKLASGAPAVGAQVLLSAPGRNLYLTNGRAQEPDRDILATTDTEGKFSISQAFRDFTLAVLHDEGWAEVPREQFEPSTEVTLQPWAHVRGQLLTGKESQSGATIRAWYRRTYHPENSNVDWSYRTETDSTGKFYLNRMVPGSAQLGWPFRYADVGNRAKSHYARVQSCDLEPAADIRVQLGGIGTRVLGQLSFPEKEKEEVSWRLGIVELTAHSEKGVDPQFSNSNGTNRAGMEYDGRQEFACPVEDDGSFALHDVPAGSYDLLVTLFAGPPRDNGYVWPILGSYKQELEVPPLEKGQEIKLLDLGPLILQSGE